MSFALVSCGDQETLPYETNSPPPDSAASNITPLLYKVTDEQGNVVWLFGSIHVGRDDYYPLPDYVLDAFDFSDCLAVEANILKFEQDMNLQIQALSELVYKDGTKIKDHIPEEVYTEAVNVLKELNVYSSMFDMYCPMFWSSMIESLQMETLGIKSDLGIDYHLLKRADRLDKRILEIESVKFQYKMMADFSDDLQTVLLMQSINSFENKEETKVEMNKLLDLWAAGNEEEFSGYLSNDLSEVSDEEIALYDEYYKAMFTDRNMAMADYAENALKQSKEVFICVGAAHIVGEDAVADLLAERGYTVELIVQ